MGCYLTAELISWYKFLSCCPMSELIRLLGGVSASWWVNCLAHPSSRRPAYAERRVLSRRGAPVGRSVAGPKNNATSDVCIDFEQSVHTFIDVVALEILHFQVANIPQTRCA